MTVPIEERDAGDRGDELAPPGEVAIELRMLARELETAQAQLRQLAADLDAARSALEAEQTRYRALFEVAPEGHVITDGFGLVRECNLGAAVLLNISTDHLSRKPLVTFFGLEEHREFRVRLYRTRVSGAAQEWFATLTPRDLPPHRVSVSLTPAAEDGASMRWLLRDVSGTRSAAVAAREPAMILRAALDALSAHVAVLDMAGRIVTVNRAWKDIGAPAGLFTASARAGANYLELCDRALREGRTGARAVRDAVVSVLQGTESRVDVAYDVGADEGSAQDASWFALRVARCEGPNATTVVVTHEDITAERQSYARERALLEERAARAAAEAANRTKSEFLTTLSHELRTPLNAIAGYAQLLEMGVRGPVTLQQTDDLRRILRSERHLLGLINELLNFSRLERGQVALRLAPVRLLDVVNEVLELVEPQAAAHALHVVVECGTEDFTAQADAEKVRQILVNVLSNALKFTPAGGTIRVECDGDDDHVLVRVHDTGVGIPGERLSEIFEPFVQVHRAFGEPTEGIGLGLAISRTLARAMRGELRAASEMEKGSCFELMLPRAVVGAALT